jgi:SAM-dependent methyltransferase
MGSQTLLPHVYQHNRRAWDERMRHHRRHTRSVAAQDLKQPLRALDPEGWLEGGLTGHRVLCLASGGGLQSVLCAAAGARVTVLDISREMLAQDERVAAEHGLKVFTREGSMDDLSGFAPGSFDLVLQPVSSCYVPDVVAIYRQVARVLVPNGLYVSQHKQPVNLQSRTGSDGHGYVVREPYYRNGPLPAVEPDSLHRESETMEFLHRWEEMLGGLCRSGFVIEDVAEPRHDRPLAKAGSFEHRSGFIPPYVKIKARRKAVSISTCSMGSVVIQP